MKSTRRSSGKGKRKFIKITFIKRHFRVNKKVVAGGKIVILFDARKMSFITTLFYALSCVPPNYAERKDQLISL